MTAERARRHPSSRILTRTWRTFHQAVMVSAVLGGVPQLALGQSTTAFVQGNSATPQLSTSSVAVNYTGAQTAGDLNVVVVGWNSSNRQIQAVTDSNGNPYVLAVGPTDSPGFATQSIYYAANITASPAGAN